MIVSVKKLLKFLMRVSCVNNIWPAQHLGRTIVECGGLVTTQKNMLNVIPTSLPVKMVNVLMVT